MAEVRLDSLRTGDRFRRANIATVWTIKRLEPVGQVECSTGKACRWFDRSVLVHPIWPERIHLTPETVVATSNRLATDPRRWRVCDRSTPRYFLGREWTSDPALAAVMSGPSAVLAILNLLGSTDWWGSPDPITWSDLFLEVAP